LTNKDTEGENAEGNIRGKTGKILFCAKLKAEEYIDES